MTRRTQSHTPKGAQRPLGTAQDIVPVQVRRAPLSAHLRERERGTAQIQGLVVAIVFTLMSGLGAIAFAAPRISLRTENETIPWNIAPEADAEPGDPVIAPVSISISSIGVNTVVVPLGLNADSTVEVPSEVDKVGWYTGSPAPGSDGASVLVGHLDSRTGPGIFFKLAHVQPGAQIAITRADGSTVRFAVERLAQFKRAAFPTEAVYGSAQGAQLRLITCGGQFDARTGHYLDNTVVFATLVTDPAPDHSESPAPERGRRDI